jgi:uncharacterized protein (TIGR02147 family)
VPDAGPDVFDYIDLSAFLTDWFAHNRRTKRHFTYGIVARNAKLGRSTLANILAGRRVPAAATLFALARAMGLDDEATGFLVLLREVEASRTLDERGTALKALFDHPHSKTGRRFDPDIVEVLSHWSYLAFYELIRLPAFQEDPAWMAAQLDDGDGDNARVTAEDAARALVVLERTGLLVRTDEGLLTTGGLAAQSKLEAGPAMALHRSLLDLARERLAEVDERERLFAGGAMTLPRAALPALRSMVWQHISTWNALADAQAPDDDMVVCMVQVQLYPVVGGQPPQVRR